MQTHNAAAKLQPILATLAAAFLLAAAAAKALPGAEDSKRSSKQAIKIEGNGDLFVTGPQEILLGHEGIKVTTKLGFFLWRTDRPDTVYKANPETRLYLPISKEEWIRRVRSGLIDIPRITRLESKPVTINGLQLIKNTGYHKQTNGQEIRVVVYYSIPTINLTGKTRECWDSLIGLKSTNGFPVGVEQIVMNAAPPSKTKAYAAYLLLPQLIPNKVSTLPDRNLLFSLPTVFKQAKDASSLYLSADGELKSSDLDQFFSSNLK